MPIITDQKHPANDPRQWVDWEKPNFDQSAFQSKIDAIAKTTPTGKPIIRLDWGPDVLQFELGHWRRRYRCFTHWEDGEPIDVGVPRWVLTQRTEPARYLAEWNRSRYQEDVSQTRWVKTSEFWLGDEWPERAPEGTKWEREDDGWRLFEKRTVLLDVRGEPPADGWYQHWVTLTDHTICCGASPGKCWGMYWEPDEGVLEIIRKSKAELDALPEKFSPYEPMSDLEFREAEYRGRSWNEEFQQKRSEGIAEMTREAWRIHGWRMLTQQESDKPRECSLPPIDNFKQTSGGLYVPADLETAA